MKTRNPRCESTRGWDQEAKFPGHIYFPENAFLKEGKIVNIMYKFMTRDTAQVAQR